jgi:hypothetical protein
MNALEPVMNKVTNPALAECIKQYLATEFSKDETPERRTHNQACRQIEKILDETPWTDPYDHVDLLRDHGMDYGARGFVRNWLQGDC